MKRLALLAIAILVAGSLATTTAQAGNFTYADGKGNWQSTQCKKPGTVSGLSAASDSAANDLNAQIIQHNATVIEHEVYLKCLSDEATRDAAASAQLITGFANQQIDQAQQDMMLRTQKLQQEND